jgi:hypothetical protein
VTPSPTGSTRCPRTSHPARCATTTWNPSIIDGGVASRVAEIKAAYGQDILKYGTGELDRTLAGQRLIDELHLWIFPVIAGKGKGPLDDVETTHLELVDTTRFPSVGATRCWGGTCNGPHTTRPRSLACERFGIDPRTSSEPRCDSDAAP